MDSKLLLVKGITLLYRESQLEGTKEKSSALVREIVSKIKPPEITMDTGEGREILMGLTRTALTMCDDPHDHTYELTELLQRVKVNTGDETELYESIATGVTKEMDQQELKRYTLNIQRSLKNFQNEEKVSQIINQAAYKLRFDRDNLDWKTFVQETHAQLETYIGGDSEDHPAIVDEYGTGVCGEHLGDEKWGRWFDEPWRPRNGIFADFDPIHTRPPAVWHCYVPRPHPAALGGCPAGLIGTFGGYHVWAAS